jgi:hypothetical protein
VLAATSAGQAQAYVYWSVGGPFGTGGGSTLGRGNLDASGVNHALITGAGYPGAVVVDGSHIYWSNSAANAIGRANLDGSAATPAWISLAHYPVGLALDATHIYWTDGSQYIGRANLDGTAVAQQFVKTGASANYPSGIAINAGTIYFNVGANIDSVPAAGGSPTTVATLPGTTMAMAMAAADGYLYFTALDLSTSPLTGAISRMQLSGGFHQDPAYIPNLTVPTGVATDGTYLYWTDDAAGHLNIGRALIGSLGATNITYAFISEPGGPTSIAVDSGIDPTSTSLACSPATAATGAPITCTATVRDSASSAAPTGSVNLTGNGAAFFSGNPCTLTPDGSGHASCVIGAVPTTAGSQPLHASYSGDPVHAHSSAEITICAGTAAQCPGSTTPTSPQSPSPPKPKPACVVPKLKGKSLDTARKRLRSAHCALGRVTMPAARKHHAPGRLVVGLTRPGPGRRLQAGGKVRIVLVRAARR